MYSNAYIFRFASIMVILVAAILTSVALLLKPYQEYNKKVEKITDILSAAGIEADASNAVDVYDVSIKEELAVDLNGDVKGVYRDGKMLEGDVRAFDIDVKAALKQVTDGNADALLPLFHLLRSDGSEIFVIPVRGKGLWGPIWGNIALGPDFNTIIGASFDHKSETPGLGAEINTTEFESQFIGKRIFDDNGEFVSVEVVKGGVANSNVPPEFGVDAISGGTITSKALEKMVKTCLSNYKNFIENTQKQNAL